MIPLIVTPLQGDTDFDIGRVEVHESATPIKDKRDRVCCENHPFIKRDVLRFDGSIAIEIHRHAIPGLVQHLDSSHLRGIERMPAHGVYTRLFGVARKQARGVG